MLKSFLSEPNAIIVTIAVVILGMSAALSGVFGFLRQRSLVGDALAHAVLPGICISFMITATKDPIFLMIGAIISGWLGILAVDLISSTTKLKSDTAIGIVLSVFFGFGMLLLSLIQNSGEGAQSGLDKFLFGKAASMNINDIWLQFTVAIAIMITFFLFFKGFYAVAFNKDFAQSIGLPVKLLEFMMSTLTVVAVAVGIQAVGVVLMSALLITPIAAARIFSNDLKYIILLSVIFGGTSGFIGSFISYISPAMPTGPWIVLSLAAFMLSAVFFSPKKGLVYRSWVRYRFKRKVKLEHFLKVFYRICEDNNDFDNSYSEENVLHRNEVFKNNEIKSGLKIALYKKLIIKDLDNKIVFSQTGLAEAKRVVRLHRLWELYLNKKWYIQIDHVHDDAETIEHILTPEVEQQLMLELDYPHLDPHQSKIPH